MDEASGGAFEAKGRPRVHWRPGEDERLRQLVEQYGPQNWNVIAEKLQGRSGKSCRFRWMNHLDPTLNRKPEEEESLLNAGLFGKRRSHNFISSSNGDVTMSNFLTKPSTDEEGADTSGLCKEITGTSMGSFLTLGTEDCRHGVTTMNEQSSYGESSAGPQKFSEEPEDSCIMHKNVGFIDFLGVGT
ncbi:uncharacterized protein LOC116246633 [Nymphaea colorata]|nr:uncharacterized protein LOC116246633 [Nymphaea colorata]